MIKIKSLIEARKRITEAIIEPSEQIIKGVQKELKLKTGINAVLGLDKKSPTALYYSMDLSKEIRTPILQALFDTLSLNATCSEIPNSVGGYSFQISIDYIHPQRGSNGLDIGTIWYVDGKFKSKFNTKARASETPY